jgi:uncharacterized membrane protein
MRCRKTMNPYRKKSRHGLYRKSGLAFVFLWFAIGGVSHFLLADTFLKSIPPALPLRMAAVYISGLFELLGAIGLLHPATRKPAGIGLFVLTVAVTPANIYMWLHPELFPQIPSTALALRLPLQLVLLALIWRAVIYRTEASNPPTTENSTV